MFFFLKKNTFFSLGQTWTWTSEQLGRLEFQKGTPAWNSISAWAIKTWISVWAIKVTPFLTWISAWAIKVSWGGDVLPGPGFQLGLLKRCPPGFGFHKGDALPGPGFRLGLLKRTPLGPGFRHGL
ncbi:unnamed protein product [Rhizophagus irregularis]|nr:unnamed protein product [Rhizophagus irregularis]